MDYDLTILARNAISTFALHVVSLAVFLDFSDAIQRLGKDVVAQKYGNLFQMYEKIVDENPYENLMMIFPAIHYTMGGIWVDYELRTSVKGLFCIGEANFLSPLRYERSEGSRMWLVGNTLARTLLPNSYRTSRLRVLISLRSNDLLPVHRTQDKKL